MVEPGALSGTSVIIKVASEYDRDKNPRPKEQCKGFVRFVYDKALGVETPPTSVNNADWINYEQYGFKQVASFDPCDVISDEQGGIGSREYHFKQFVSSLAPGDAIQIDGTAGPHTMLFIAAETADGQQSGIRVIDANWYYKTEYNVVYTHIVSFDGLWDFMGGMSSYGMRAYRYAAR